MGTRVVWALALGVSLAGAGCGDSPTRPTPLTLGGVTSTITTPPATTTPAPSTPAPTTPAQSAPTLSVSRILCFGDSLTEGYVSLSPSLLQPARPESYPWQLQLLLSERYRAQTITVTNAGRSGEWVLDGQYRIVSALTDAKPDAVVLMQGANDLAALGVRGIVPAVEALENMLRDARAYGAQVLIASLPPERPGALYAGAAPFIDEYNARVRALAARQGVLFVDVNAAFRGDLTLIGADGLHPTPEGYVRIAQAVFDVLRTNFEKAQTGSTGSRFTGSGLTGSGVVGAP